MFEILFGIIFVVLLTAILMAVLSPLESLGWWAGWYRAPAEGQHGKSMDPLTGPLPPGEHFIVFLTGIGSMKAEIHIPEERHFLDHLIRRLDTSVIVDDIFPYSVTNTALTGNRIFRRFWNLVYAGKEERKPLGFIANVRNMFQVLVSSDHRYGPMYDRGTAQIVLDGLARHGYLPGSGTPVYIIGYSGGGQISIGCAPHVARMIDAPVYVISLGGVFCADPALAEIAHLYHIHGSGDGVTRIGQRIFPGRWSMMKNSYWNQALAAGKVTFVDMGEMVHNGPGSYLDTEMTVDGVHSYMDKTVEEVARIVTGKGLALPQAEAKITGSGDD
jgi:hypothetical protein